MPLLAKSSFARTILQKYNSLIKMEFENTADKSIALKAMREAIDTINYTGGYTAIWLQDLEDDSTENGFNITSTLDCEEINLCIPAMCKAVAKALPDDPFKGYAYKDDLKCYWIDDYEFSYDGKVLHIKETFMDDECEKITFEELVLFFCYVKTKTHCPKVVHSTL